MGHNMFIDLTTNEVFEDNQSNYINFMIARNHKGFVVTGSKVVAWYNIIEKQAIQKLNEIKKEIKLWDSQNKWFIANYQY